MFSEVIQTNYTMVIGLTVFLVITSIYPLYKKRQNQLFRWAIVLNLCMLIVVSLDFCFAETRIEGIYIARRLTSFLNFAMGPILPLILWQIFREKQLSRIAYVPAILNILLCFASMFVRLVFEISEFNKYARGIFFLVPISISIFYMIMMISQPIKHIYSKASERLFIIFIIITMLVSVALESGFNCRFLNWNASGVSLILYYLLLSIQSFITDPLTGAYNRTLYNKELSNISSNKDVVITMIDINDFKHVNDKYGHGIGDQYLNAFSAIILENINKTSKLYRVGGDEFVILSKNMTEKQVDDMVQKFKVKIEKRDMAFAYGISMATSEVDINDALKEADKSMYLNKKNKKCIK